MLSIVTYYEYVHEHGLHLFTIPVLILAVLMVILLISHAVKQHKRSQAFIEAQKAMIGGPDEAAAAETGPAGPDTENTQTPDSPDTDG